MTANEIMERLFLETAHGEPEHREWLHGKYDAFALFLAEQLTDTYQRGWDAACRYWNPEYR